MLRQSTALKKYFDRSHWEHVDGGEARADFDTASKLICAGWLGRQPLQEARRRSRSELGNITAVRWLEVVSYQLLVAIIDSDTDLELFAHRCRQFHRDPKGKSRRTNLFQQGIMALFAHDKNLITPRDRERIGKRLWHAYRHFVPPVFLAGFFKQIPSYRLLERASRDEIEPEFEEWVIGHLWRAGCDEPPTVDVEPIDRRGPYPAALRRRARARVAETEVAEEW